VQDGLLCGLAHPKLARVLTALHERPGQAWSLQAMAQQAGMSRSAFAAEFKAALGSTPADYLLRWRIAIAQTRLRSGTPAKTVSDELGYASASAFSRAFTQVAGVSPRNWLKSACYPRNSAPA
jgi:AraC-like DNA-binding protein